MSNHSKEKKWRKKTRKEPPPYSGFVLTFEPERTVWLAERIHTGRQLAESFSAVDWEFERKELAFLVLEQDPVCISAIVLMERMHGSGGSGKLKMRMSEVLPIEPAINYADLPKTAISELICTPETLKRSGPDKWDLLVSEVKLLRPYLSDAIDLLQIQRTSLRRLRGVSNRYDRLNEQRDGVGISLDIAEINRSAVLKTLSSEDADSAASILDLLDSLPIQERSLLEHDAQILPKLLPAQPTASAMFSKGQEKSVRIYIVDKTPIETALGVDLVIHSTSHDSYLLLQYKKMSKEGSNWAFHIQPSSNTHQQLIQMDAFLQEVAKGKTAKANLWSYRLNSNPFYFKFCEQLVAESRDDSLIPGITMCEEQLREFIALPEAKGIKGGIRIGYDNCPRYLNNTEFIQLARGGWIGVGPKGVTTLKRVIEKSLKSKRNAMVAIIDTPKHKAAHHRGKSAKLS